VERGICPIAAVCTVLLCCHGHVTLATPFRKLLSGVMSGLSRGTRLPNLKFVLYYYYYYYYYYLCVSIITVHCSLFVVTRLIMQADQDRGPLGGKWRVQHYYVDRQSNREGLNWNILRMRIINKMLKFYYFRTIFDNSRPTSLQSVADPKGDDGMHPQPTHIHVGSPSVNGGD